jgi:hypothetical protein
LHLLYVRTVKFHRIRKPCFNGLEITAAAAELRDLLLHADQASMFLWDDYALETAINRYVLIFLPTHAAYLSETKQYS